MEQILLGLLGSSPAAVAVIITVWQFLKYLREERKEWRDTIVIALNNNSQAMTSQTMAMKLQTQTIMSLVKTIEDHDTMARAAIARLEIQKA